MNCFERNHTAKAIKNIRKILQGRSEPQDDMASEINWMHQQDANYNKYLAFWLGLVFLLCAFSSCEAPAHAYTDEQYLKAIRHAEGTWTYGIKTVKCTTENACHRVCLTTISHNRRRYSIYGYRQYPSFTEFLGSRYCPTQSGNLSTSEIRLNRFWISNVSYFLRKDV